MDPVSNCQRATDAARAIVSSIQADAWAAATPCEGWDARALVNHMIGVCVTFVGGLRKSTPDAVPAPLDLGAGDPATVFERATATTMQGGSMGLADGELAEAYRRVTAALMAEWRADGTLERTLQLPFGEMPAAVSIQILTADSLLHAWDLAKALGQPFSMDDDVAAATLAMLHGFYDPAQRGPGKAFAQPIDCPEDAPLQDRLVAFSGRQP